MTAYEVLTQLQAALAAIPTIASCAIGIEANVTAASYPLIRIVPTRLAAGDPDMVKTTLELTVYFGVKRLEAADGLPAVYEGLLTLETAIREAALFTVPRAAWAAGKRLRVTYRDTAFDEDRLPHYKLMASRFEVEVEG